MGNISTSAIRWSTSASVAWPALPPPLGTGRLGFLALLLGIGNGDAALAGVALLVIGARLLVTAASDLASAWGMSDLVIGLTVVAIGTSTGGTQALEEVLTALPRVSLNGNYQDARVLPVLTSGAATAMWNGFRRTPKAA